MDGNIEINANADGGGNGEEIQLIESELVEKSLKKHFLDYDYENQSPPPSTNVINEVKHVTHVNSSSISSNNNNKIDNNGSSKTLMNKSQCEIQLQQKKKISGVGSERPSTSTSALRMESQNKLNSISKPNNNVESILSMLGSINSSDVTAKFLEISKNREMCATLRLSGCISLLVQILHSNPPEERRQKESLQALHNIINCHPDDKAGRREARVLKLIEQLFDYCDALRAILRNELSDNIDRHPIQGIGTLMKISFDEEHRYAMCQLGALQTIATLIQLDHAVHGAISTDANCITMRRYAGMCLTNLTFGDGNNKALLCSNKSFMRALVDQINSTSDELVQVTASVIRNLSWRADTNMKDVLCEIGTMRILTNSAMKCSQENTLKALLSALWNLSNHCSKNKAEFCEIDGAIEFLIDMLSYEAASKTSNVIENAGGILRNISTHIALHEELRVILRGKNCLSILLQQLKSPSLTVVSNACGTLGNLSAHCAEDQKFLRDNGAIPMLRSLIYSKHKMISTGSTIALRHLLACKPNMAHTENLDSVAKMMDLKELPTLNVRKQKALEQELNMNKIESDDTSPLTKDDLTKDFATSTKEKMKVQNIEDEDEDAPTNFSKFDDDQEVERTEDCNFDQITDYSVRYAENDYEDEERATKPVIEDSTKCYNTEGTPHAGLSSAGSMSDLRREKLKETITKSKETPVNPKFAAGASGFQSPEKTVNYCVEGTPGNFSRNDSLSDLDEASTTAEGMKKSSKPSRSSSRIPPPPLAIRKDTTQSEKESTTATPKSVTFGNLADETPLMFSRTSSIASLDSAEPGCVDDKSSVVSDFSRLASGVISPSELPDSPTQSLPQSPSQLQARSRDKFENANRTPPLPERREVIGAEAAEDIMNEFHVENTPAIYSYATSLSNLSFDDEPKISTDAISKDYQLMKHPSCEEDDQKKSRNPHDENSETESEEDGNILESCINLGMNCGVVKTKVSDEGTNNLDAADSQILQDCIQNGIQQFVVAPAPVLVKDNPLDMMRNGSNLLPPYLPVVDELNRFIVEDSPCNFSISSDLSAITIESNAQHLLSNKITTKFVEPGTSKKILNPISSIAIQQFDDSLSSLSVESEDDGNVLSQVIAAGVESQQKSASTNPIDIPVKPRPSAEFCNESVSSVDSIGREDAGANSLLLEQCIQSGINKVVKKDSSVKRGPVTSSPKKSLLPKPGISSTKLKKSLDKKDEELLQECIKTGILSATKNEVDHLQANITNLSLSDSKNGVSTSVTALDSHPQPCASTITGVEASKDEISRTTSCKIDQDENIIASKDQTSHPANWTTPNGFDLNLSFGSVDENILERSNEYPAGKLSIMNSGFDIDDYGESLMEISNEFMVENEKLSEAKIEDKHKDPDLMMKSVDRLTQELVSTAEYLRKNQTSDEISKMSGSNTWNDENSFPSISMSAPMIGSTLDEATFDQKKEYKPDHQTLDDKTPTNEQYNFVSEEANLSTPKVVFKVGGEIGTQQTLNLNSKVNLMNFGPASIETNSTMSNSTIVQVEAKKIANRINSMTNKLAGSTTSLMDLENVRPPSSMDCMSLTMDSVQNSPMRKRTSMTGIVAKRAIGHHVTNQVGSHESVCSVLNLESIRPPSIMDELLDSMISVDSIVSEIVDPVTIGTLGISHYETAMSDMDDSLTLRSCHDLSKDETLTGTGTSDEFSSVESTPKKRSKSFKNSSQNRQMDKERYKTYTIQMDSGLDFHAESSPYQDCPESPRRSLNARQRRQEDRHRFESQSIEASPTHTNRRRDNPDRFKTYEIDALSLDDDRSILAMTENFKFLNNSTSPVSSHGIDTNEIRMKLNKIKIGKEDSLEYERQNSETESQRDARNSSLNDENSSVEHEEDSAVSTPTPPHEQVVKIVRPKNTYVSPYRMTTAAKVSKTTAKAIPKPTPTSVVKIPTANKKVEVKPRLNLTLKTPPIPAPRSSIPKPTTTPINEVPPKPPIRQGTFIQDEPTLENVPVVVESLSVKTTPSKLKQTIRATSSSKIPSTPTIKKNPAVANLSQMKFRSNSNTSMKSPVVANKPVRSNTGINLSNQRKNVTSKIAGLWKSQNPVDKKKENPTLKKSIPNSPNGVKTTQTSVLKRNLSSGTKGKIIRSSTCEEIV